MKRVILDSNIYGKIIEETSADFVLDNLPKSKITVYGSEVIRKELRDTPKNKIMVSENKKIKIRLSLLSVYDFIVKGHQLKITGAVEDIAEAYYLAYRKFGGIKPKEEIINDFRIVSTAAINGLDIIYSEDNKTMVGKEAAKSYELVNTIKKLNTLSFKSYEEFKNELSKK